MNGQGDAFTELRHYIQMQKELLSALAEGSDRPLGLRLGEIPVHGELRLQSQTWDYTRHGAGILFRERNSTRQVDVPVNVDNPELFDLWRLVTYFCSLGRRGVKILERASGKRGMSVHLALEGILQSWQASGEIIKEGNGLFSLVTTRRQNDAS